MTDALRLAVFCDVDDTIIRQKSLFELLRFADRLDPPLSMRELDRLNAMLEALKRAEISRQDANALYYRHVLSGRSVSAMGDIARAWFAEGLARGAFLDDEVVAFLAAQRARGFQLVLVTGSFAELLEPLAQRLGATAVLGAPLEKRAGRFTGRLLAAPCIGSGKATAVAAYARSQGLELANCIALGDDITDLDFLKQVGFALVPRSADPELRRQANELGWQTLGAREASPPDPL